MAHASAGIQELCEVGDLIAEYEREGGDGTVVLGVTVRAKPSRRKRSGAQVQRCIVGDVECPGRGETLGSGIINVGVSGCYESGELRSGGEVDPDPSVLRPAFQGHPQHQSP